ncbi:MAG: LytR/AlgR family response regulator transcription factor [Crocinitomicaceae bacterium]
MNIIIIEDDPLIAFDIKTIVESTDFKVIHVFHKAESIAVIDFEKIDLAILDINLNGSIDGIDIGKLLIEKHQIPSIFITSYYDQKTIKRAKEVMPLAYILKPYEEKEVLINLELSKSKIINRVEKQKENEIPFYIKVNGKQIKILSSDILYAKAYDIYCHLYTKDKRYTLSSTLKDLTEKLVSFKFLRVHRSFLINTKYIDGITADHVLIKEQQIPVGRTYKKMLANHIHKI